MPENDASQLDGELLLDPSPIKDADLVIERASVAGLLRHPHARVGWQIESVEIELLKGALMHRFTKAQVESMDRLTAALDRASITSTKIQWGLFAVSAAGVLMAVLTYIK